MEPPLTYDKKGTLFCLKLLDYDMVNSIFEVAAINLGGPHQIDKMGLMKAYETVLRDSSKQ